MAWKKIDSQINNSITSRFLFPTEIVSYNVNLTKFNAFIDVGTVRYNNTSDLDRSNLNKLYLDWSNATMSYGKDLITLSQTRQALNFTP